MNKIILIGFMGAGKSSVAAEISSRLKLPYVDLDRVILECSSYQSIAAIIDEHGEDYFRELETQALIGCLEEHSYVLACGGGTAVLPENAQLLQEAQALVVYISVSFEKVLERIPDRSSRPLLRNITLARDLYEQRKSTYKLLADLEIDSNNLTIAQVAELICESSLSYVD